jgi:hypothetical protein
MYVFKTQGIGETNNAYDEELIAQNYDMNKLYLKWD